MKPTTTQAPQDLVQRIFKLGKRIDLAFDPDTLHPTVRSTIINECDYKKNSIIIAQSTPKILPSFRKKKIKLTTMVIGQQDEKMRVGVDCALLQFLNNYQLSSNITESAILAKYYLPIQRSNIRGAYRIKPNRKYNIHGKIIHNGHPLVSGKSFSIKDISGTGIGLFIIRAGNRSNPLFSLVKGKQVVMELTLTDLNQDRINTIKTGIQVIRNHRYSNKIDGFIGGRYVGVHPNDEECLFQFIHNAQAYQIRNGVTH